MIWHGSNAKMLESSRGDVLQLKPVSWQLIGDSIHLYVPDSSHAPLMQVSTVAASGDELPDKTHPDFYRQRASTHADALSIPINALGLSRQVHGGKVLLFTGQQPSDNLGEADAVIAAKTGLFAGMFVADCLAVFLYAPKKRICAAIHAGWRGACAHVARNTVLAMQSLGVHPEEMVAVMAAGICKKHMQVGEELIPQFADAGHDVDEVFIREDDELKLDIRSVVAMDLLRCGIAPTNLFDSGLCSICNGDLLWSYRREGRLAKRNLAAIGWKIES
jgi:polyphenol oxidase